MAEFIIFPEANDVLKAAPGTEEYVHDLAIFRPTPYLVSCVKLDDAEVDAIRTAGCVYLQVCGQFEPQHLPYLAQLAILSEFPAGPIGTPLFTGFAGENITFPLNGLNAPAFLQPLPGQTLADGHLPAAVVCYALTDLDVARVMATRRLYVRALGQTHPPIAVHATNPITFSTPAPEAAAEALSNPA